MREEPEVIRYWTEELERELEKHAGKWVITTRDELVAVADTPEDAFRIARERGVEGRSPMRLPDEDEIWAFPAASAAHRG